MNQGATRASTRVSSFPPALGDGSLRVLILGSMPGVRSLAENRYYAHPQNYFWTLMGELFGAGPELDYARRLECLHDTGVGLWDVLKHCKRSGSLDSAIARDSEVPNDIPALIAASPQLRAIGFNGGTAWATFRRHVLPQLPAETRGRLALIPLPSTSPANAGIPRGRKLEEWGALKKFLGG